MCVWCIALFHIIFNAVTIINNRIHTVIGIRFHYVYHTLNQSFLYTLISCVLHLTAPIRQHIVMINNWALHRYPAYTIIDIQTHLPYVIDLSCKGHFNTIIAHGILFSHFNKQNIFWDNFCATLTKFRYFFEHIFGAFRCFTLLISSQFVFAVNENTLSHWKAGFDWSLENTCGKDEHSLHVHKFLNRFFVFPKMAPYWVCVWVKILKISRQSAHHLRNNQNTLPHNIIWKLVAIINTTYLICWDKSWRTVLLKEHVFVQRYYCC